MNATGRVYMSSAVVGGAYILRCAIGNSLTEERHVREAWSVVQEHATAILSAATATARTNGLTVRRARCDAEADVSDVPTPQQSLPLG